MFITATRLRTKIGGISVNEMRIFTSKGEELDNTRSHKLLGVYVDQDLSVDEHIEQLCKKLAKRIALLRSIRQYLPLNERIFFYNPTVKSVFLYSGAVWSSTYKCNIRRIFLGLNKREQRTVTLFKRLDWTDEINVNKLCLVYKCLNGQCPEYLCRRLVRIVVI